MSDNKRPKSTEEIMIELIIALLEQDAKHYSNPGLRWTRITARLATMIAEWSRSDYTIRRELARIQAARVKKK